MTNGASRRVALVTGGTGGIGSGVALALTEHGFDVVVSDLKIAGEAVEAMKTRAAPGTQLAFVQGNVADVDDHARFVGEAFSAFGRIDSLVNVAGVSAKSTKAAATMMTKLYALRLAQHGIAVYEVRPGLIKTPMTGAAQERYDKLLAEGFTPINRWGTPEDIGRAVASMAVGDLPFTTGAAIPVDGGMHIHYY